MGALLAELQKFKGGGDRKSNHSAQPEPSGLSKKGRPAQDRDLGNVDTDSGLYSDRVLGFGMDLELSLDLQVTDLHGGRSRTRTCDLSHVRRAL